MSTEPLISVAPMEGVTTFPMRLWLQMVAAPEAMTSPFLRVTRVFPENELPLDFVPELFHLRGALPYSLVPQYICGELEPFLRAASLLPPVIAPMIELNCGCPSPNSMGRYAGSGILREPEYFARSVESLCRELGPGRLAIKMRLGIDSDDEFPSLLAALVNLPLGRLTVHGRTRADGYRGLARWERVEEAAASTQVPVHASGDIWGLESWERLQNRAPHIKGAMVGRGLLRNPWIFSELTQKKPVEIEALTFIQALFAYLLLQELCLRDPEKLLQRVAKGRLGSLCALDFSAWERVVVELTALCFGVPFLLLDEKSLEGRTISPVAFSRLRFLWTYLRSSLPEELADTSLNRARSAKDFFGELLAICHRRAESHVLLCHQKAWDVKFCGLRA